MDQVAALERPTNAKRIRSPVVQSKWEARRPPLKVHVQKSTKDTITRAANLKDTTVAALVRQVIEEWAVNTLKAEIAELEKTGAGSTRNLLAAVKEIAHPAWRGLDHLTGVQRMLLDSLSSGRACSNEYLLDRLQAYDPRDDDRQPASLKTAIHRLRLDVSGMKIEILTLNRLGYKLAAESVPLLAARRIT